jgi:hypothetical protein
MSVPFRLQAVHLGEFHQSPAELSVGHDASFVPLRMPAAIGQCRHAMSECSAAA